MSDPSDISQTTVTSNPPKTGKSISFSSHTLVVVVAVIVFGGLCFWGGALYQKHNYPDTKAKSSYLGAGGFGSRFGGGGFGDVTSISDTSITVQNSRTGTSTTYAITSSTTITDNGQTVAASSITAGETVAVIPSSSDSSDASRILVNPSFGGYQSSNGSSTSSTTGL